MKKSASLLRPYICHDCRARIAALPTTSKRLASSTSAQHRPEPQAPVKRVDSLAAKTNAEAVQRRIQKLDGEDAVAKLFPRLEKSRTATLSAAEFARLYAGKTLSDVEGDRITVFGKQ